MKKLKYLSALSFCLFSLTGCNTNFPNEEETIENNQQPAQKKIIKFDGVYVQTYSTTWPIAFDSYTIENEFLIINGNFCIPGKIDVFDIDNLERELNENTLPYIISYQESHNSIDDIVYSNFVNTKRDLKNITSDKLCYFSIEIDISPLVENNKSLGELVLNDPFSICCFFGGEKL